MTTIEFQRIERDCPHNKRLREGSATYGLIYDFNVVINGEHRATFKKIYGGVGYNLLDTGGNSIKEHDSNRYSMLARNQREFLPIITNLVEAGRIPTLQQMAEAKAEAERKKAQVAMIRAERERVQMMEAAGVDLYEALKPLIEYMRNNGGDEAFRDADGTGWLTRAERAIAKAEGRKSS